MKKPSYTTAMFHSTKTTLAACVVLWCLVSCSIAARKIVYDGSGSLQTCKMGYYDFHNSLAPSGCSNTKPTGNFVKMLKGKEPEHVFGAFRADGTEVRNNKVVFKAGEVDFVYGGVSFEGNVNNNVITINGGTIDQNTGGMSYSGNADYNSISISGGTITADNYGGSSYLGNTNDNSITISGSTIKGDNTGGRSGNGDSNGNSITIIGGMINGSNIGGLASSGSANSNNITIVGGTVNGNNKGGHSDAVGNANNNILTISGGTINGSNLGGYSIEGNAINNTITIKRGKFGHPIFGKNSELYGGLTGFASCCFSAKTGNTLNLHTTNITVKNIYNFENLRFYVQKDTSKNAVFLTLTDSKKTDITGTKISVVVEGKSTRLKVGDAITLIKTKGKLLTDSDKLTNTITGKHKGSVAKYNFAIEKVDEHTLVAKVTKVGLGKVN